MKPQNSERLYVVSCSKEKASEFIFHVHRHHLPLDFGTYSLAVCTSDGTVHGVAIIGRTTTQHMKLPGISNQWIQEVRRVATDGFPNACSALYGAAWRFVRELGYRALISYTLPEEGGSSLMALGWDLVEDVGGNPWAHRSKRGYDIHPVGKKLRWQVTIASNKIPAFDELQWPVYDAPQKNLFSEPTMKGEGVGQKLRKEFYAQTGFFEDGVFETIGE